MAHTFMRLVFRPTNKHVHPLFESQPRNKKKFKEKIKKKEVWLRRRKECALLRNDVKRQMKMIMVEMMMKRKMKKIMVKMIMKRKMKVIMVKIMMKRKMKKIMY